MLDEVVYRKEKELKKIIKSYQKVIVSYSGGIDSTLLAFYAHQVLDQNALIAIGDSPSLSRDDLNLAITIARENDFHLVKIYPQEFNNPDYLKNDLNRCYFCKKDLFQEINALKKSTGAEVIMDGTNYDDLKDTRPGLMAAKQEKVIHPLVEVKLNKKEIRLLAKKNHLPNHDKPSSPCLASRIPHGLKVDLIKLNKVEKAEKFLRDTFAASPIRVRCHEHLARIESSLENVVLLKKKIDHISAYFEKIGFSEVEFALKK